LEVEFFKLIQQTRLQVLFLFSIIYAKTGSNQGKKITNFSGQLMSKPDLGVPKNCTKGQIISEAEYVHCSHFLPKRMKIFF
jgi:hypothetical protein